MSWYVRSSAPIGHNSGNCILGYFHLVLPDHWAHLCILGYFCLSSFYQIIVFYLCGILGYFHLILPDHWVHLCILGYFHLVLPDHWLLSLYSWLFSPSFTRPLVSIFVFFVIFTSVYQLIEFYQCVPIVCDVWWAYISPGLGDG